MPPKETLNSYIRQRCKALGLSMSELARLTGLSRQTLHALSDVPARMPALSTLITLANALEVHPLRLVHLVFDASALPIPTSQRATRHDQSVFVRDVTYADGTWVLPGQRFTKTWEMQNVGKLAWEGRFLQCMDEEVVVYRRTGEALHLAHNLRATATRVPIAPTQPGELVQISVDFIAPEPPGTVLSYWKSVFSDGTVCFPNSRGLWVKVNVTSMAAGAQEGR